ncbi:MAG: pyruvate kinase [bacterium]|nr:pyruvate kinase [bacterium]
MLIVSLPPVHQEVLLKEIITHPHVGAVRYNTGMSSPYEPREVIRRIQEHAAPLHKPVWVDLKGKQLRVTEWANLPDGPIVLNHRIKVQMPAKVCFRGDDCCQLKEVVDGNKIYVDPLPKAPVGRGQSVNILTTKLEIEGGLLPLDYEYIQAALQEGVTNFMLSFVESMDDVRELENALEKHLSRSKICLKIESQAGLGFVNKTSVAKLQPYRLMAARDDLMIQVGVLNMLSALKLIIGKDQKAICASRLFLDLEKGDVSMADISDLELMRVLGYRYFMLSDGISREHFPTAIKFWQEWIEFKKM